MLSFFVTQALVSAAVLVLASVICIAMRRRSAAHRYFVWLLAFATLLATPVCAWLVAPFTSRATIARSVPVVTITTTSAAVSNQARFEPPVSNVDWKSAAIAAWAAACSFFLARTAAGLLICARRRRRATVMPAATTICKAISSELQLRTHVDVLTSAQVTVPETFGIRRPAILLPQAASGWPHDRLRIVLLHELVHVKRGDWAVHLFARITASLFWCNPLTWYALARLQDERERACDDDVLRFGVAQSEYAEQLVEIARSARTQSPALAVAMTRPAHLEGRIRAILNPQTNRRSLTLTNKAITLIPALLVIATISLVTAPAQTGNAQISGIVKDPSGARVPGVEVLLAKGSAVETMRTNATGGFEFSGVPDGTYTLKVMAPGFKLLEISDVVAKAFNPAFVNLTLQVGAINERITITAQGQARQQPPIASTALQQDAAKPRTVSFASVLGEAPAPAAGPQRIPIGGNIRPSRQVKAPRPLYPAHLAAQGVEGTVMLAAIIGTSGQVLNVTPKNSQVNPELIQGAVEAVRQWQYEPTLLNGQPVEVVTTVTIEFALKP